MRKSEKHRTVFFIGALFIAVFMLAVFSSTALAVPETTGARVTDVTTASFSVVWMTDVTAEPAVEVYMDDAMAEEVTDKLIITPMPAGNAEVVEAARGKGIMKVRVSGLSRSTKYHVRTVTREAGNSENVGYSGLIEVTTASEVVPYRYENNTAEEFSNDLLSFRTYIRPSDAETAPCLGDILILESEGASYPVSVFVGDTIGTPEAIIDLNNIFGPAGRSLDLKGMERLVITVYRGGMPATLTHYRRVPLDEGMVYVADPEKGFFADINLDGKVDDEDFGKFKDQYRTLPDDINYNPDYNYVEDEEAKIDAREFSKFSREYGRTDVR